MKRLIELLAPAKDISCAKEAILSGADAVYIGAPRFGARFSASNSFDDLSGLVNYAHFYNVRVYVTFNVILYDSELKEAEDMIWKLWDIGVDALIIQDLGITELNIPPIPLHASTQMDNRTPEKVSFLRNVGFRQVVLARELSLSEIKTISRENPDVRLESFIHGAICVSYSGQCYLSKFLFGRSANRGECAQPCRLKYDLVDDKDNILLKGKYFLSQKDMNRTANLEELIDSGVSSFKIEGRLKDLSYVKNVTSWYRKKLDEILEHRSDLSRSSSGISAIKFTPVLEKSFNRGFTSYFLNGAEDGTVNFLTPKSIGEKVGVVSGFCDGGIKVKAEKTINNGDGLSYFDNNNVFNGFRVNKVDGSVLHIFEGNRKIRNINIGAILYRTFDCSFEGSMNNYNSKRLVKVDVLCSEFECGFKVSLIDEDGNEVSRELVTEKIMADKPQMEKVSQLLSKLGNTPFYAGSCVVRWKCDYFVPSSLWNKVKHELIDNLLTVRSKVFLRESCNLPDNDVRYIYNSLSYLGNVSNDKALDFYKKHGVSNVDKAYEVSPVEDVPLMFTKYCIKRGLGLCTRKKQNKNAPAKIFGGEGALKYFNTSALYLKSGRIKLRLDFDCNKCEMLVFGQ